MLTRKQIRSVICYDNDGETIDRYTVIFKHKEKEHDGSYQALGMSSRPFHPQGFCQHCYAIPGKHLGKRIVFRNLPKHCQEAVEHDLKIEV